MTNGIIPPGVDRSHSSFHNLSSQRYSAYGHSVCKRKHGRAVLAENKTVMFLKVVVPL